MRHARAFSLLVASCTGLTLAACANAPIGIPSKCLEDANCGSNMMCIDGVCVQGCNVDADCETSGLVCIDGGCLPEAIGGECEVYSDCINPPGDPLCFTRQCLAGRCLYPPQVGNACGDPRCEVGVVTLRVCAEDGSCIDSSAGSCEGFACAADGQSCREECASDDDCVAGYACAIPDCVLPVGVGDLCITSVTCGSGLSCVQGVCCESACDAVCYACLAADNGVADGLCRPVLAQGTDADGEALCIGTSGCSSNACACDGDGHCIGANDSTCTDDTNCASGHCVCGDSTCSITVCAAEDCPPCQWSDDGSSCNQNLANSVTCSADGIDCTEDYCDGGSCVHPALPDGTACGVRTCATNAPLDWLQAVCSGGLCTGTEVLDSCNDANPCTTDSCDPVSGCTNVGSCQEQSFGAVADAWLEGSTSHGSADMLLLGKVTGYPVKRSLLRFDLGSIPSTATVMSAELRVYQFTAQKPSISTETGIDRTIQVHQVLVPWVEDQVTSLNAASGQAWGTAYLGLNGVDASASAVDASLWVFVEYDWQTFDVTAAAADWVTSPGNNHGLLLWATNETTDGFDRRLHSREYSDTTLRPELVVVWY